MVFEGFLTNESGPYTVKVSKTTTINNPVRTPFANCEVTIHDDKGYSEILTEKESGTYITKENGIQGTIGNKYRITITTPDDKKYETEFQEMLEPVGIDSLYANIEYLEIIDDPIDLPGYQFYVSTEKAKKDNSYFLWNLTETYEYTVDFTLYAMETDYGMFYCDDTTICPDLLPFYTCWRTDPIKNVFTAETESLTISKVENKKLHFVGTDSRELLIKYSLLVKQYTINKGAHMFWKAFEDQISDENILSATQPFNTTSNIKNKKNLNETIFGYFTVASLSEKRIFVESPPEIISYEKCYVLLEWKDLWRPRPWYYVLNDDGTMGIVEYDCLDCRSQEGTIDKPEFWLN